MERGGGVRISKIFAGAQGGGIENDGPWGFGVQARGPQIPWKECRIEGFWFLLSGLRRFGRFGPGVWGLTGGLRGFALQGSLKFALPASTCHDESPRS